MKRRNFICNSAALAVGLMANPINLAANTPSISKIRLGAPLFEKYSNPEEWIQALKNAGYLAAYCPVNPGTGSSIVTDYRKAAAKNDIIIAEVGAWSNPISPDEATSKAAMDKCITSLELADQIGAACCVNISGSRNPVHWAGPHPDNLTNATFDLIVETTRKIIDAVKPRNTFYTLEAMPWTYPDSADSYLKLIKAIDRQRFAVHLDPVNWVVSPQILYSNGDMIKDAFKKLGKHIKSCHAKDVSIIEGTDLPQLIEVLPGTGFLDYRVYLTELVKLGNIPLMLEHLKSAEEYFRAAQHIRMVANNLNLSI
jgi:sugar phosphate isomerase/epimerase